MDRKRKSVFAPRDGDSVAKTRTKTKHQDCDFNGPSSQYIPSIDIDSRRDIETLENVVNKIIIDSENGSLNLSPEIVKAARDLDRALRRAKSLMPCGPTGSDAPASSKTFRNCTKGLPPLPPIMNDKLEKAVFTHPGVSSDPKSTYDRLEVLGDAYIELIATRLIWDKFPQIPSGRISQIRELLVKNETLADYAATYGLDGRASVPQDYINQPKRWTKTKGDIFESYVAAVILSHHDGYSVAEEWLSQLWLPKLDSLEEPHSNPQAKETLAKRIMGKGVKLKYVDERPPLQHEGGLQTFFIGVYLTGWGWDNKHLGSGQGLNKTIAGNKAAQHALENKDIINAIVSIKREAEKH